MLRCRICGEDNQKLLEKHHVTARKHSSYTEWLCLNCHRVVTNTQNNFPAKLRKSKRRYDMTIYALGSVGALLGRVAEILVRLAKELSEEMRK